MLAGMYNNLYSLLLSLFGYTVSTVPDMTNAWLVLFSLLATLFILVMPFIVVYKVVRWSYG